MATGILRLASTPPGSATVIVEASAPLRFSDTEIVASVTRLRSTHTLFVSTQLPIAITSDWLTMSATESATAKLVSGVLKTSCGGALTAFVFVAHRTETSRARMIRRHVARVVLFIRGNPLLLHFVFLQTDMSGESWEIHHTEFRTCS